MAKSTIYLLVEPVNILPIWFSRVLDGLKQNSAKNRYTLHQLSDVTELDGLENLPATVIVLCSQTGWTRHMVQELKARRIMPLLLGVIPEQFGYGVSGIMFARQGLVEKLMDYFVDCGRKKIALTGVNHGSSNDRVKVTAFLQKALLLGLPLTEDDVYYVDTDIDNSIIACVNNAEKYDGVICSNDYIAAVLMAMNGLSARELWRCTARATNSLPVPDSPVIITVAFDWLSRPIERKTSCIAGA